MPFQQMHREIDPIEDGFNSDRNYEKSDGFRHNQISRIRDEAKKLLGEEADDGLPDFMKG